MTELKEKLQKLQQSAALVAQRVLYERAGLWAVVEGVQLQYDQTKEVLEVGLAVFGAWVSAMGASIVCTILKN